MKLNLQGKVVVITGGVKGIGLACVRAFLEEGCQVAVCASSSQSVEAFRREEGLADVLALACDVSSPEQMQHLAAETARHFGGIHVWINNAGYYPAGDLEDMPVEAWKKAFAVNVDGVLYGARAAIPYLRKAGGGVIINAASFATLMPTAGRGAYGITKGAVGHLTRVLAAELAPDNIRVTSYMPGFVVSTMTEPYMSPAAEASILSQSAQKRYGYPEDIAPAVVFLASDAAAHITGNGLEISGGKYCVQNPGYAWNK